MKNKFIESTLKFSLIGFFIPAFTFIGIGGLQGLISTIVKDCELAWNILFILMTTGAILTPFIFGYMAIRWDLDIEDYKNKLLTFNLIEYTLLQGSLSQMYSESYLLCYGTDGQNGLQFVFSAWIGLILLNVYSFILDQIYKTIFRYKY